MKENYQKPANYIVFVDVDSVLCQSTTLPGLVEDNSLDWEDED